MIELIKLWLNEAIRNQEGLKKEYEAISFPDWNQGYLDCLNDLLNIIKENE